MALSLPFATGRTLSHGTAAIDPMIERIFPVAAILPRKEKMNSRRGSSSNTGNFAALQGRRRRGRRCQCISGGRAISAVTMARADGMEALTESEGVQGRVLVWFKHDLRLDDHPGLASALQAEQVTPVFIFDPNILGALPPDLFPALFAGVASLREDLRDLGSGLVVRSGNAAECLAELAAQVNATTVIAQAEVEASWQQVVAEAESQLGQRAKEAGAVSASDGEIVWSRWEAKLYHGEGEEGAGPLNEWPDFRSYEAWKRSLSARAPLEPPTSLPPLPPNLPLGSLPSLEDLVALSSSCSSGGLRKAAGLPFTWSAAAKEVWEEEDVAVARELVNARGEASARDLLEAYLRFQEPTSRSDWQEFYFFMIRAEDPPGSSFSSLFRSALALGTLSRRRVLHEAFRFEVERGGGWISPFGFSSFSAKAAVATVEAAEYYMQMASLASRSQGTGRGGFDVRYWRWKGMLAEFCFAGDASGSGPAILLVHGFGAFWGHFRDNIPGLAQKGNRVWALTLPGFGRSEKPCTRYTPALWHAFVRDFILEVVGEPVGLAGNSIGGYFVASVAHSWPALVSHLILFNSAGVGGPVLKEDSTAQKGTGGGAAVLDSNSAAPSPFPSGFPRPLAWALSRLLFAYLQANTGKILRRCYPKVPARADKALVDEIIRASRDPGAPGVVESVFYLPKQRPLTFLLNSYGGPVLVVQGRYDPLNDADKRAKLIKGGYPAAHVRLVEAGKPLPGLIGKAARGRYC
eukprot:TRINITY_DN4325_c0_g1_i3.p1 TRINITY_DN4325_c0_g1~~TRINITY_DN4325_c0_g1_i3.p1  ORF type:complete len:748 (-),score=158.32 TRINITY_DN4325_c0_g1_i3:21-2264(-)